MKNSSTSAYKGPKLVMRVRVRQRLSRRMLIIGSGVCMAMVAIALVIYFQTAKVETAHAQPGSGGDPSGGLLSNTVVSGGDVEGTDLSVSYSIGQLDYINISGTDGMVTQGVQQPFEIFVIKGKEVTGITLTSTVYPNPSRGRITLEINESDMQNLSFSLFDMLGKLLMQKNITDKQTGIQLYEYSSDMFILKVFRYDLEVKTFKIVNTK